MVFINMYTDNRSISIRMLKGIKKLAAQRQKEAAKEGTFTHVCTMSFLEVVEDNILVLYRMFSFL